MTLTQKTLTDAMNLLGQFPPEPFNTFSGFPLRIIDPWPQDDQPKIARIPAHPIVCWLAKFFRIDPWVEVTIPPKNKPFSPFMAYGTMYMSKPDFRAISTVCS